MRRRKARAPPEPPLSCPACPRHRPQMLFVLAVLAVLVCGVGLVADSLFSAMNRNKERRLQKGKGSFAAIQKNQRERIESRTLLSYRL